MEHCPSRTPSGELCKGLTWWSGGRVMGQRRTTPGAIRAALARQGVRSVPFPLSPWKTYLCQGSPSLPRPPVATGGTIGGLPHSPGRAAALGGRRLIERLAMLFSLCPPLVPRFPLTPLFRDRGRDCPCALLPPPLLPPFLERCCQDHQIPPRLRHREGSSRRRDGE